jgi:hypothetical protein
MPLHAGHHRRDTWIRPGLGEEALDLTAHVGQLAARQTGEPGATLAIQHARGQLTRTVTCHAQWRIRFGDGRRSAQDAACQSYDEDETHGQVDFHGRIELGG